MDRAQAGVLSSRASLEGVRQDLALRVLQAYADWFGAQLKRLAYDKSLATHQLLQDQIDRRIAGGISPQSDLTLLLGRKQQTEADLSAALAHEQTALGRLTQLLGHGLQPNALNSGIARTQPLGSSADELLQQAQAQAAQAEVAVARSELLPEVYLRAESQYGSYAAPNVSTQNRFFVGLSSRFGAGLSSLSQVRAAQARYEAALADIDSTRLSLGEQILADYAQAQTGAGPATGPAGLAGGGRHHRPRLWGRQFVAGRKTWPDLMNAVRELAQLEAQIADARAAQLLLSWRLAIVGRGLESALQQGQQMVALAPPDRQAPADLADIPLAPQDPAEAIELRMALGLEPLRLGLGLGLSATPDLPTDRETSW